MERGVGIKLKRIKCRIANNLKTDNYYPSAKLSLKHCCLDYQRLQEIYNKLYDKINFGLVFSGGFLTIAFTTFDFSAFPQNINQLKIWQLIVIIIRMFFQCGGLLLLLISTLSFLCLLLGKKLYVFKSEDLRNGNLYREKEDNTAVWLIDKYTKINDLMRPIIREKQKRFDITLVIQITGVVLYAVSIILTKGGF